MAPHKFPGGLSLQEDKAHTLFNKEVGAPKHIAVSHFVSPEIFSTKNGDLGAVIKTGGVSSVAKSPGAIHQYQRALASAIKNLGSGFACYETLHRHLRPSVLEDARPGGLARGAYNAPFKGAGLFVNDVYITIIKKPDNIFNEGANILRRTDAKEASEHFKQYRDGQLQQFKSALANTQAALRPYAQALLGAKKEEEGAHAGVLGFLSILINGGARGHICPSESIASIVPETRPFFGNGTIHYQGLGKGGAKFGAVLSVKQCPPVPGALNNLLNVPFEYISTHSFLSVDKQTALGLINKQIGQRNSTEGAAKPQIAGLEIAKDGLAGGRINYGHHHNTLLVLSDTATGLEERVGKAIKIYQGQQLSVVRETVGLENAFWAQIPGNFNYIRHHALISNNNFAGLCSLHHCPPGRLNKAI